MLISTTVFVVIKIPVYRPDTSMLPYLWGGFCHRYQLQDQAGWPGHIFLVQRNFLSVYLGQRPFLFR